MTSQMSVEPLTLVNAFIDSKLTIAGGMLHTQCMWQMTGLRKLATVKEVDSKRRKIMLLLHADRVVNAGQFLTFVQSAYTLQGMTQDSLHTEP